MNAAPKNPESVASRASLVARITAYAGTLLAAAIGVYVATRDSSAPAAGHAHEGKVTASASQQAVSLTPDQERRIGVTFAVATVAPLGREVRTVGVVAVDETRVRSVSSKVDGWADRLYVSTTGEPVGAGDPLVEVQSPMLVQAQEELLLARGLQQNMSDAGRDAQGGVATLVESARRRLAYWDVTERQVADIERSNQVRRTLTFYSPASGVVLEKLLVPGQRFMAGEALFRIADLRLVWVEGEVFEQDLADVRVGQVAHADFPALPGEHRMGRIAFIYPTVSAETRTTRVRVVLPNGDLRLKPGMYATLRIAGAERSQVLTVPRDAVLSTGERSIVFVRERDGRLAPTEVAIGASSDERIEILRGLHEGATVVSSATFLVDAESNLAKAIGGMGNMPGMDMGTPPTKLPMQETTGGAADSGALRRGGRARPAATDTSAHAGHKMP